MRKIKASQDLLARLCDFPAMRISRAVNHQEYMIYEDWRKVESVITDLEEIVRRSPIQPDWKNYESVKVKIAELESERRNPPPAPDASDWELLSATTPESIQALATKRGIPVSDLMKSIDSSMRKFDFVINTLRRSNSEMQDLERIRREDFEASRQ
jgi:hypothetical protein